MYECKSCAENPCSGRIKYNCKIHPDNFNVDFGPDNPNYWKRRKD
jgi:hypothetical protein